MSCSTGGNRFCVDVEDDGDRAFVSSFVEGPGIYTSQSAEGGWIDGTVSAHVSALTIGADSTFPFNGSSASVSIQSFTSLRLKDGIGINGDAFIKYIEFTVTDHGKMFVPIKSDFYGLGNNATYSRSINFAFPGTYGIYTGPASVSESLWSAVTYQDPVEYTNVSRIALNFLPIYLGGYVITLGEDVPILFQYDVSVGVTAYAFGSTGGTAYSNFANTSKITSARVFDLNDQDISSQFDFLAPDGTVAFRGESTSPVPEPASAMLMSLGLGFAFSFKYLRRK